MASPTSRSLQDLRENGYQADVVERFIIGANIRKDLFGMFDIVAMRGDEFGVTGVQVTTTDHLSEHWAKIFESPFAPAWLKCGNRIVLHGWSKKGDRGKRKLWTLTKRIMTLADFA